jgi:hypothetical protein
MKPLKLFVTFFALLIAPLAFAQNGFIRGTIYDASNGQAIPGATVSIEGTNTGTITDLDGKFSLAIPPDTYNLRVSFVSYEPIIINEVPVKTNEATLLEDLRMKEATFGLAEVVVTGDMFRNNENALLTLRKKAPGIIDGISASNFKLTGDGDAAASIKRLPGVSIEDGKYVFIRGLGDRYTKTILNGVDIPGLDPDRNTLQMDIFPSNIIDNIIVHKSFSADLPADFTGGVVDIAIKEFPEEKIGGISLNAGYNPGFHFNEDFLTYKGGKTDFLGFDDGTREIPASSDIPFFSEVVGNADGEKGQRYREILGKFNPSLAAFKQKSFMDFGIGTFFGNQFAIAKTTLGYNLALSYKSNTEFYNDAEFARYGLSADPAENEMDVREFQSGDYGVRNVLLSGLAGLAIKTLKSKIRINLIHLQNGESKAGIFDYFNNDQGAIFTGFQHNLEYNERSLTNLLIHGKHSIFESGWEIEWKLSPTISASYDPDIRFTRYEDRNGSYYIGTEGGFPERIWRELDETNLSGLFHIARDFKFRGQNGKFQAGGAYTAKTRDFMIRSYALNIRNVPLTGNPDELFYPENLWPMNGNISSGTTYEASFIPSNPNQFNAQTHNAAAYLSAEMGIFRDLRTVIGLRTEKYLQYYTGQDQLGNKILDNEKVLDNLGFFPSINLIYSLHENQNLRLSFSKTIARPSFKELSYAEIFDPVSGRTFIGGLFRDANDIAGIEYWDGKLTSTDIHNYDLRWELFQQNGHMVSLGAFYKKFYKPIEIVQFASQTGSFQPRNVGDGQVMGAEIEFRQNLSLLGEAFRNFNVVSNVTLTDSRIRLSETEYNSRIENARIGQDIGKYRPMAGQAPFIINTGLSFNGEGGDFWKESEAGLFYYMQASTLQFTGIVDRPDIYLLPFHSLNFNFNQRVGRKNKTQVGIKIDNILNSERRSVYKSFNADDQNFAMLKPGRAFQFRISYDIF